MVLVVFVVFVVLVGVVRGAALARSSAEAVAAAGPTRTVTTAQATVHGVRKAVFQPRAPAALFALPVFSVRLLLIFPTSSRLLREER
ncbi:hypothetical protein [Streptomyces mirabilis]|uniref:hypothetical protein n=1 Tax=Streptomyces mirabilis TaxID=68239 RepID=UPI0036746B16